VSRSVCIICHSRTVYLGTSITLSALAGARTTGGPLHWEARKLINVDVKEFVVLLTAGMSVGAGGGVMGCLAYSGRLTPDAWYITAVCLVATAVIVGAKVLLYRFAADDRAMLRVQITRLERTLTEHKVHDRAALVEAVQCANTGTDPVPLHRIGR
jgi:hypothetical protein